MNQKNSLIKEGFVSFLFLGKSPVAPGTFGSFGALLLSYFIIENVLDYSSYLLLLLAGMFYYGGMQIAPWCEKKYGKDPGIYVIDEVIGYLIAIGFLLLFEVLFSLSCHLGAKGVPKVLHESPSGGFSRIWDPLGHDSAAFFESCTC